MKTPSRRIVTAALLSALAMGSTAAIAGEGGGAYQSRVKLKAEWAEARARNAANPGASFVERLFGLGDKKTAVATAKMSGQPKKN